MLSILFNVTITICLCCSEVVRADNVNEKRYIFVVFEIEGTSINMSLKTLAFRAEVLMGMVVYSNQGNATVTAANAPFLINSPSNVILF